jgi:uncharacterized protein YceK
MMKIIICVVLVAVALSGCGPTTEETTPAPTTPEVSWVVNGYGTYGDKAHGHLTFYVECVPADDLAKPSTDQHTWREVQMPDDSTPLDEGAPCPGGKVLEQHPG